MRCSQVEKKVAIQERCLRAGDQVCESLTGEAVAQGTRGERGGRWGDREAIPGGAQPRPLFTGLVASTPTLSFFFKLF